MSSGSTTSLFYRDLGARWQHDDSRWRPKDEKNVRKRVGGFARWAPLPICPDWKGVGMQCSMTRREREPGVLVTPTSGGAPRARRRGVARMFASLSPLESHSRLRAGKRTSDLIHDTRTPSTEPKVKKGPRVHAHTNRAKDEQGKSRDTARIVHRGPSTRPACRNARAWQRH